MSTKIKIDPGYGAERNVVKHIDDFVDGAVSRVRQYLWRFDSETATDEGNRRFGGRARRLVNENQLDPILRINLSYLARPVTISQGESGELSDVLVSILDDADLNGHPLHDVYREIVQGYLCHGRIGILVDGPANKAPDQEGAKKNGERAYIRVLNSVDLLAVERVQRGVRRGKLSRVLVSDGVEGDKLLLSEFTIIDGRAVRQEYRADKKALALATTREVDVELGELFVSDLDEIPIVIVGTGVKETNMRRLAHYNEAWINGRSIKDNIDYYQGFQRVIVTGTSADSISALAEHTVVVVKESDAGMLIIPPGDPLSIERSLDKLQVRCRREGLFEFSQLTDDATKQIQSAESKAMDLKARETEYRKITTLFESAMGEVFWYIGQFENIKNIEVSISKDFDLSDPEQERSDLREAFAMAGAIRAYALQKRLLKAAAMTVRLPNDPGLTQAQTLEQIFAEIDALESPSAVDPVNPLAAFFGGG